MAERVLDFHPLFLPEQPGDEPPDVVCLSIDRERPFRESCGKTWEPSEFQSEEDLADTFGPGTYYVRARNAKKHVTAGRRITIRGAGAPLSMNGSRVPASGYEQGGPVNSPAPVAQPASDTAMVLAYMREAQQAQERFFATMMAQDRERSDRVFQSVIELAKASTNAHAAAVQAAAPAAAPVDHGDKLFDMFQQGLAFATEMNAQLAAAKTESAGNDDSLEKSIVQLASGWFASQNPQGGAPMDDATMGKIAKMVAAQLTGGGAPGPAEGDGS